MLNKDNRELRGKIVLELESDKLPVVVFFGEVKPMDVQYSRYAIAKAFRIFMMREGKKELAARKAAKEKKIEEDAEVEAKKRGLQIDKDIDTLKQEQEELANKGNNDEPITTKPTKEGSGNPEESSRGSGSDNQSRNAGAVQPNRSGRTGHSTGRSQEVERKTTPNVEVHSESKPDQQQGSRSPVPTAAG